MAAVPATTDNVLNFTINVSQPVTDGVLDISALEKFLHEHIKIKGRTGQLGNLVKIVKKDGSLDVQSTIPFSKRYLKYLTKKFLKKNKLRDYMRVVATNKLTYEVKYYNVAGGADDEDEEEEEADN